MLKTSGVVKFVGNRMGAIPLQNKEINNVRAVLEKKISCSSYPFLQLGHRVRIRGGSLDDVEGILVGRDSVSKLVIAIELIQRSVAVSVHNFDVEPVASCAKQMDPFDWGKPGFKAKNLRALSVPTRGAGAFADGLDLSFRTPEDVSTFLELPALASIPKERQIR